MIPVEDTALEGSGEGLENTLDFPLPPISCRRKPGGMDSGKYANLPMMYNRAGDVGQRTSWETKKASD